LKGSGKEFLKRLTGWRNALSTGYAWILAIRFGIGESATFISHTHPENTI
jgi:hypothetical protein